MPRPANDHAGQPLHERWALLPPLEEGLPLSLANGSRIDDVSCSCPRCGTRASPGAARGTISPVGDRYIGNGWCLCRVCPCFFPFRFTIAPDRSGWRLAGPPPGAVFPTPENGRVVVLFPEEQPRRP